LQRVPVLPDHHGVAGIVAALVADDEVVVGREQVDDLGLALVTPLGSHDGGDGHRTLLLGTDQRIGT